MSDERQVDFSALDPTLDRTAFDAEMRALVCAIDARGRGGTPAPDRDELLGLLAVWFRPAMRFVVPVAVIAASVLLMVGPHVEPVTRPWTAGWVHADVSPSPLELLAEVDPASESRR